MAVETDVVFWHDGPEALLRFLDFYKFQNFGVIFAHFTGQRVGADVDNIYVGVFQVENTGDLCIFFLFILVNRQTFCLCNRIRVDMDLESPLLLDLRPALLKLLLHFAPNLQRLSLEPGNFNFS
jgi:hypothetical protein